MFGIDAISQCFDLWLVKSADAEPVAVGGQWNAERHIPLSRVSGRQGWGEGTADPRTCLPEHLEVLVASFK